MPFTIGSDLRFGVSWRSAVVCFRKRYPTLSDDETVGKGGAPGRSGFFESCGASPTLATIKPSRRWGTRFVVLRPLRLRLMEWGLRPIRGMWMS